MSMSTTYIQLHDQIIAVTDAVWIERDPIKRLALADALERDGMEMLREIKRDSAYAARQKYGIDQISTATGLGKSVIYKLISDHVQNNPQLGQPKTKNLTDVSEFIDLRHILQIEKRNHLLSKSPTHRDEGSESTPDHDPEEQASHSL